MPSLVQVYLKGNWYLVGTEVGEALHDKVMSLPSLTSFTPDITGLVGVPFCLKLYKTY